MFAYYSCKIIYSQLNRQFERRTRGGQQLTNRSRSELSNCVGKGLNKRASPCIFCKPWDHGDRVSGGKAPYETGHTLVHGKMDQPVEKGETNHPWREPQRPLWPNARLSFFAKKTPKKPSRKPHVVTVTSSPTKDSGKPPPMTSARRLTAQRNPQQRVSMP